MANSDLASEQQAAQIGLLVLLHREIAQTFTNLDVRRLAQTLPSWVESVHEVIGQFGEMAGGLALDYYDAERDLAGVTGAAPSPLLTEPGPEQVDTSLRWATKNLWSDDVLEDADEVQRYLDEVATEAEDEEAEAARSVEESTDEELADLAEEDAKIAREQETERAQSAAVREAQATRSKVNGIADRLVTNVGRTAILDAVGEDRRAAGWARYGKPDACAFCRMMAIRGVVYKSAGTAGRDVDSRFDETQNSGVFKYHNACRCWAVPYFEGQEWQPQPQIPLWEEQYRQAKAMPGDTISNYYAIVYEAERNQ